MAAVELTLPDGAVLRGRRWPAASAARGTVLLVHGLGEHVGRYDALAAFLNRLGFDVAGFDQRGHGRSDGARGRIPRDDALPDDLSHVVDRVRGEPRQGALVLLGHSLGGLVAARFVAEALAHRPAAWSRPVDALVLSSPALETHAGAGSRLAARVLGALVPDIAVPNGLDPDWISRDPAVVAAYRADPLVHPHISPRLARFLFAEGEAVRRQAARWRVPTTLLWAGSDRCVAPSGSRAFAAGAPPDIVRSRVFEPLYHEIFNEPERETVFAALGDALATLLDPPPRDPP